MNIIRRRVLPVLLFLLASATIWTGSFLLCQANNDFPVGYQPDEPTKGEQLIDDERNFHHPLLMLNITDWVARQQGTPRQVDAIVLLGRNCSAGMAATGGLLIAWAGLVAEGWAGFVLLGLAGAMCPAVVSHAHYFKEEAALTLGVGAVVLAGSLMCRSKHMLALLGSAVLLGMACGTAASGKYPGAVFLIPSAVLVIAACGRRWVVSPIAVLLLAAVAVATWVGINQRAVQSWHDFQDGLNGEEEHVVTGHFGLAMDQPNSYFANAVWNEAMPHVALLLPIAPFVLLLQRRRAMFGLWLLLTAAVYLVMLSYCVVPFFRYAVPVTLLIYVIAALTIALLARMAIGRPMLRGLIIGIGAGVIGVTQLDRCIDYDKQFGHDSRTALRKWVIDNIPQGSWVVVDSYTELHNNQDGITVHIVRRNMWAADVGSVQFLKQLGNAYVITASSGCDRFLIPGAHGTSESYGGDGPDDFNRRRDFYETLKREGAVVWQSRAEHPMQNFNNPDITVYRLFPKPRINPGQSNPPRRNDRR